MGDLGSPAIKSEPNPASTYQPYIFHPPFSAMSNDQTSPPVQKPQRRAAPRSSVVGDGGCQPQQEKGKKQRSSSNRNSSGRGALSAAPHFLPGEEITYTPTTHRISKAKKGKKVHSCTFPGCPKVRILPYLKVEFKSADLA